MEKSLLMSIKILLISIFFDGYCCVIYNSFAFLIKFRTSWAGVLRHSIQTESQVSMIFVNAAFFRHLGIILPHPALFSIGACVQIVLLLKRISSGYWISFVIIQEMLGFLLCIFTSFYYLLHCVDGWSVKWKDNYYVSVFIVIEGLFDAKLFFYYVIFV